MPQNLTKSEVNTGSGFNLEPSGNKPLPELMWTPTYAAIWHHTATMNKEIHNPGMFSHLIVDTLIRSIYFKYK